MHSQESNLRPTDSEVRASAGRIIDILQQLVLASPEMIISLEEVVREHLAKRHIGIVTQVGGPDLLGLLEPPAVERARRKRQRETR